MVEVNPAVQHGLQDKTNVAVVLKPNTDLQELDSIVMSYVNLMQAEASGSEAGAEKGVGRTKIGKIRRPA